MTAEAWRWQNDAACKDEPLETFFSPTKVTRAKQICSQCPVMSSCRSVAVDGGYDDGIWGGFTPDERRVGQPRRLRRTGSRTSRRSELVTPVCRSCDAGLGWPVNATAAPEPSAGIYARITSGGDARFIVLVREDVRFRPSLDGSCACPQCGTHLGHRVDGTFVLDEGQVALSDTRQRQRQILAAS